MKLFIKKAPANKARPSTPEVRRDKIDEAKLDSYSKSTKKSNVSFDSGPDRNVTTRRSSDQSVESSVSSYTKKFLNTEHDEDQLRQLSTIDISESMDTMEGLNAIVEMDEYLSSDSDAKGQSNIHVDNNKKPIDTDPKMEEHLNLEDRVLLRLKQQKNGSNDAATKELHQSQKPDENHPPLLERNVSKYTEDFLNTKQDLHQLHKMKQLTLDSKFDMELLDAVVATRDNMSSGVGANMQQASSQSHKDNRPIENDSSLDHGSTQEYLRRTIRNSLMERISQIELGSHYSDINTGITRSSSTDDGVDISMRSNVSSISGIDASEKSYGQGPAEIDKPIDNNLSSPVNVLNLEDRILLRLKKLNLLPDSDREQSQEVDTSHPFLKSVISKYTEEFLNTEQDPDQLQKMKLLTLDSNFDMELLDTVVATNDTLSSGAGTFMQKPVDNHPPLESIVSKYSGEFVESEHAVDSFDKNDGVQTVNLSNASYDEGIDTSMKSNDSDYSRELNMQDKERLLKRSILKNSSHQQTQHMDKEHRVRFFSCDAKDTENQPDERLSDHDADSVLNYSDNEKVIIIKKLREELLELSREQNDHAKLLEDLKLENMRLDQQMKQEKIAQEANLALWMKRCSRLAAREKLLEKQLEAHANAPKEEPSTPTRHQLDPDGDVIDDVAEDIYMNKLKQLNAHILMLNTEVDHWKTMYERLNDQFEIFLYSRGEEAHNELLYSKEVIKVMQRKCEKLTYALAKKNKELQRQKRYNDESRAKEEPTIDVVTSGALKMSLGDITKVSGSRNRFRKMFMSEVLQKNQSTKRPPNRINQMSNSQVSNTTNPISSTQTAYPSILRKRTRSTSLDSRRVNIPNRLERSASWGGKSNSTASSVLRPAMKTNSLRSCSRHSSSSSSDSSASEVSADSPSSDSYSLYGVSSSDSSSSDSSAFVGQVEADKQQADDSMTSAAKDEDFNVSNSSLNSLNSLTCSVYHMPYKGKQSRVNGLYSGHIDIKSRLPNGFGELKCTNGDVMRGNWKMGVLKS